ncbi:MAG: hypothetical protein A3K11_05790 [Nitrospirae bacterium RIFCSPLOWO2_12_FULL_63_8]|nr:MAG: hypothetical protein A3K11_05790 [Nitrospirae bacterium RIFCSPLOWO2_12_FULL_63_8]
MKQWCITMPCLFASLVALLTACSSGSAVAPTLSAPEQTLPVQAREPVVEQVFRAPDWTGAVNVTDGGCNASMGEYTLWVYARGSRCGVSREQADRVVIIRQPLPGVGPLRAATQLPAGRYAVWVYGAGDPGNSQIRLCAKGCIIGELSTTPEWVPLDRLELRENQTIYLRSWKQNDGHTLHVQAVVLSITNARPDWTP